MKSSVPEKELAAEARTATNDSRQRTWRNSKNLFRDAHNFLKMFFLLDSVEHECCNRFARKSETHLGSGTFLASISRVFFLGETWRAGDRPVEPAAMDDSFHGKRIAHVISKDKSNDPIGNTGEMRGSRENNEPFHS